MDIIEQIETAALVSPKTGRRLRVAGDSLVTDDGAERYPYLGGRVPVLLADTDWTEKHTDGAVEMKAEYARAADTAAVPHIALLVAQLTGAPTPKTTLAGRLRAALIRDHRSRASVAAFRSLLETLDAHTLAVSVGGGPIRIHPALTNLNIGPFPNVDVVADAHRLPYADAVADAVFCEAVLEHLHDPPRAVAEMHRILKPGGRLFAASPFLFAHHGYPHHYLNFTLTGHVQLFTNAGFHILESGPCVGPLNMFFTLGSRLIREFAPRIIRRPLHIAWILLGLLLRPLDARLTRNPRAHILAATTYLLAEKKK